MLSLISLVPQQGHALIAVASIFLLGAVATSSVALYRLADVVLPDPSDRLLTDPALKNLFGLQFILLVFGLFWIFLPLVLVWTTG